MVKLGANILYHKNSLLDKVTQITRQNLNRAGGEPPPHGRKSGAGGNIGSTIFAPWFGSEKPVDGAVRRSGENWENGGMFVAGITPQRNTNFF